MISAALYVACVLIWGSTWYAIKLQLGPVPVEWSVAYRFILAGLILLAFCAATGRSLRFTRRDHAVFLLLGALQFSINYILVYWASEFLTSGLVALAFSTLMIFNVFNGAIFLRQSIEAPVVFGALLGLSGIALVFWPELEATRLDRDLLAGIGLGLLAPLFGSLGNTTAAWAQTRPFSLFSLNAWSMLYGGLLTSVFALGIGKPPAFDPSPGYVASLLYLAVVGTIVAFLLYFLLIKRAGIGRAGYITVLFPIVALIISDFLEPFDWSPTALAGIALAVIGNGFLIRRRQMVASKPATAKPAES